MVNQSGASSVIEYGAKLFTGVVMGDAEVDLYNKFTKESEGTICKEQKEFLLDQRHRHMMACAYA